MKKLFVNLSLLVALGVATIGGIGATTLVANAETKKITTTTRQDIEVNSIVEDILEMYDKLNSQEVTKEEQKEMAQYLKENLPTLIKGNEPVVGDGIDQVSVWLELMEANKQVEQFGRYLDTIDLEQYQPITDSELEALLND